MPTLIKAAWTAATVIIVVWPLLFWGKPALPDSQHAKSVHSRPHYDPLERPELLW
jgi:hypothetical protein